MGAILFLIFLALFVVYPLTYYVIGSHIQKYQLRALDRSEILYQHIEILNTKIIPENYLETGCHAELVTGSVVMSIDAFRAMMVRLRQYFGGSLSSYETIASIARREIMTRMQAEALGLGATVILNVRYETSNLDGLVPNKQGGKLEFFCYGTAIIPNKARQILK